ncbi:MAG: glycosyltransferase family 39 protein [Gemmatimonadaceae bacterium]|nr:glycosyltransferase family 39 protein [Gemmatimonadaceae bacterium]
MTRFFTNQRPAQKGQIHDSEVALASGFLLLLMLGTLAASGGFLLMSKPLWLDEYHTWLLADQQSVLKSLVSLAQGADFNPPTLHLIYRVVAKILGGLTPFTMRVVSLASVWLALTVAYATLRRHVSRPAAFVGSFALWAHPLVITHAFDARFYGPWLLFTALMTWSVGLDASMVTSKRRNIALALSSALECTIHYFGIFVWVVIVLSAIVADRGPKCGPQATWRKFAPALSGPLLLVLCTPFYFGQRQALSVSTWVDPINAEQLRNFAATFYLWPGLLIPLCGWVFFRILFRGGLQAIPNPSASFLRRPEILALLALAALPVVLLAFSVAVQPSMISRYAIPSLLLWPPLVAFVIEDVRGLIRAMMLVGYAALAMVLVRVQVRDAQRAISELNVDAATILSLGSDATVVCRSRHRAYQLGTIAGGGRPLSRNICTMLDFDEALVRSLTEGTPADRQTIKFLTLERDVARVHSEIYGFPRMTSVQQLQQRDLIYVLEESWDPAWLPQMMFPAFSVRRVAARMFLLQRVSPAQISHGAILR